MFNPKKPLTSSADNSNDKKKIAKPKIVATKASMARENAIVSQLKEAANSKPKKRKLDQSDMYQSSTSLWNERPTWDLRVIYAYNFIDHNLITTI
jgi:hypothetical protein